MGLFAKQPKEQRRPVLCPKCQTQMVCMNLFDRMENTTFVWYVCPRRTGEKGCGYSEAVKVQEYKPSDNAS
jgi:hypothetical protein